MNTHQSNQPFRETSPSHDAAVRFIEVTAEQRYTYQFSWMGRPIIQFPQDMVAMQEIIWKVQPDVIIETGIAHGGSLIYYASLLQMLGGDTERKVLGIDVDIRDHNRKAIEAHPMFPHIEMIQGSAIDADTTAQVTEFASDFERPLVVLDSNHTHEHVLEELRLYSGLVRKDSYLIVFDTLVEDMPAGSFPDRPWDKGDNPKTAVWEFLTENDRFEIDRDIQDRILITVAPDGYLRCVKD
jgi:cephalosporin hydroxylase